MTHEEYKAAANHWTEKDADSKKMPADQLWAAIEQYIQANNTCALATGSGSFVRCTPIEYAWHDGAFWMFSEGGQKFIGLEKNKQVCLAIYDRYDGFGRLKGMQVTGRAEIIAPFSEEYISAAERKKIPADALKKLPFTMNLLKIRPTEFDYLNSDFKKDGYDSRQHYESETAAMHAEQYHFYGWKTALAAPVNEEYAWIHSPQELYDLLSEIWCRYTCAPRLRDRWSPENPTLGQCSITAFLAQDIFGGKVYGIVRPGGSVHCYNVVGECVFDLTSEQFQGEEKDFDYLAIPECGPDSGVCNPEQHRMSAAHFGKEEKRRRYEYLREELQRSKRES